MVEFGKVSKAVAGRVEIAAGRSWYRFPINLLTSLPNHTPGLNLGKGAATPSIQPGVSAIRVFDYRPTIAQIGISADTSIGLSRGKGLRDDYFNGTPASLNTPTTTSRTKGDRILDKVLGFINEVWAGRHWYR